MREPDRVRRSYYLYTFTKHSIIDGTVCNLIKRKFFVYVYETVYQVPEVKVHVGPKETLDASKCKRVHKCHFEDRSSTDRSSHKRTRWGERRDG